MRWKNYALHFFFKSDQKLQVLTILKMSRVAFSKNARRDVFGFLITYIFLITFEKNARHSFFNALIFFWHICHLPQKIGTKNKHLTKFVFLQNFLYRQNNYIYLIIKYHHYWILPTNSPFQKSSFFIKISPHKLINRPGVAGAVFLDIKPFFHKIKNVHVPKMQHNTSIIF